MSASWYSDEALRLQEAVRDWPEGETPPISMLCGLLEPRVPPLPAEKCHSHGLDARDEAGGSLVNGHRYCGLCIARGYDEDDTADPVSASLKGKPDVR